MKKSEIASADYRSLPFATLLNHWRVTDQGDPPIKKPAIEFGVSEPTWSRWENGSRFPSPALIQRLADYLGIPPCRFFCGPDWQCPRCARCANEK
ncbi:MAG: helix-turn-helix transcriptional regulator [Verrucomicrobia bacterium]|nr:helix-turn-helix transcriptional regulator [Verrucomicrobiota bacterium]